MDRDDRTFSISQIREARDEAERQLATLQRRLEALRKMSDAADELELAEHEMSSSGAAEAHDEQDVSSQPRKTGDRALLILQASPGQWWTPRQMHEEMVSRGWAEQTKDARAAIRVALGRLAQRDEQVDRKEDPPTHAYRWAA